MQILAKLLEEGPFYNRIYLSSIMFLNITKSYAELNNKVSMLNLLAIWENL